jgi:hypothetical protein
MPCVLKRSSKEKEFKLQRSLNIQLHAVAHRMLEIPRVTAQKAVECLWHSVPWDRKTGIANMAKEPASTAAANSKDGTAVFLLGCSHFHSYHRNPLQLRVCY